MGKKIFGDADRSVHMSRRDTGIVITMVCQDCERQFQVEHRWPEVRMMLEGYEVAGVQPVDNGDGWEVSVQCTNYEDGCNRVNKYKITADELEDQAAKEVARRKRLQTQRGGGRVQQRRPQQRQVRRRR
jgi:hypothetical protein